MISRLSIREFPRRNQPQLLLSEVKTDIWLLLIRNYTEKAPPDSSITALVKMELLYPGYQSYFSRFLTKSFHTEYSTRYCNSDTPVLYSQVPKYTWHEPRRPTVATRHGLDGATKLTYLRPPFAARMTSYEPEERYPEPSGKDTVLGRSSSSERKDRHSAKLPNIPSCGRIDTLPLTERGSRREHVQLENYLRSSPRREPAPSLSRIVSSSSATRARKFHQADQATRILSRDQTSEKSTLPSNLNIRDERILGRVAPRPSTLLSKHPKDVRYVRDTCFFYPTLERKKHYYIVNPNWFSEQRVTVPKNNVFS